MEALNLPSSVIKTLIEIRMKRLEQEGEKNKEASDELEDEM